MPAAATMWNLGLDMALLGIEANAVIALRMLKLAQGGAGARAETQRMIGEKWLAMATWPLEFAPGDSPMANARASIRHFQEPVRANRRRLMASR